MILPKERDPRLITVCRGGALTESDHRLHALWAAACAEHVLHFFEMECPADTRPREAIEAIRAWTQASMSMMGSRTAGGHAMGAARELTGAARHAAYAAGQAACVAHVAEHNLGAAAYAIKAARAGTPADEDRAARLECRWQREQLPDAIRDLVIAQLSAGTFLGKLTPFDPSARQEPLPSESRALSALQEQDLVIALDVDNGSQCVHGNVESCVDGAPPEPVVHRPSTVVGVEGRVVQRFESSARLCRCDS